MSGEGGRDLPSFIREAAGSLSALSVAALSGLVKPKRVALLGKEEGTRLNLCLSIEEVDTVCDEGNEEGMHEREAGNPPAHHQPTIPTYPNRANCGDLLAC